MKRFIYAKGALRKDCTLCDFTIAELFEETGIPESELIAFDKGTLALPAGERFAIMRTLHSLLIADGKAESSRIRDISPLSEGAWLLLLKEVEDEDREEESALRETCAKHRS